MTSPNPFADEPQPTNVVRLQSAADPLDPYAAPAGAEEYRRPVDPGVGVWRDGDFLVVHLDADFPRRCLLTNAPTNKRQWQTITWSYAIDWSQRHTSFTYGMSPAIWNRNRRVRHAAAAAGMLAFLSLLVMGLVPRDFNLLQGNYGAVVLIGLMAVIVIAILLCWHWGYPLRFVKARQSYLWLSGGGQAFLNSLPVWPGLK